MKGIKMKIEQLIINRLQQLINFETQIEKTRLQGKADVKTRMTDFYAPLLQEYTPAYDYVDASLANQWGVSCLQIIGKVSTKESDYYIRFDKQFSLFNSNNNYSTVKIALGILRAVKDDYENGYLFDTRTLIEAEVFDDFLEQAEQLLEKGYYQPAAVIVGCVLEDGLRKLCDKNSIVIPLKPTIDPMNIKLAKEGIYNKLWQKKITALADLRNKAAHGKWDEFEEKDVEDMIRDVRRFMEDYFS
jgi:hypothetical protein